MKILKDERAFYAGLAAVIVTSVAGVAFALQAPNAASAVGGRNNGQADSARFQLWLPEEDHKSNDVVYCGVKNNAEPYTLSVAASNPPAPVEGGNQYDGPFSPSHDGAGWLEVGLQGGDSVSYNVPFNDSFSFDLTLGGRSGADQIVQLLSPPKGDESGGGTPINGFATVRAQSGATDPFEGDGRNDNFCVTIDADGNGGSEYTEGQITTSLPVPDGWVVDGNGADGGALVTLAH